MDEWHEGGQRGVAPSLPGRFNRRLHADQRSEQCEQLHLIQCGVGRGGGVVAVEPTGNYCGAVLESRKRIGGDAAVRVTSAIRHGQVAHIRHGIGLGQGIEIGGHFDGMRIQHQNGGLIGIGDAIYDRSR